MSEKTKDRLSFLINITFVAVVVLVVYLCLKYVIGWVLPFLLAFCIVSLINPLIRLIKKKLNIKQELISLVVMLLVYAVVAVLIFLLILQLIFLVQGAFSNLVPYYNETVQPALIKANNSVWTYVNDLPPQWQEQLVSIQGEIIKALQSFLVNLSRKGLSTLSGLTSSVPSFMIAFVFTIMLSFFISMQYSKVIGFFRVQLPQRAKTVIGSLRGIISDTILKYLKAALTLMAITFCEVSIGLLVLGTKNAIGIAAGIAVFDALPFFGTGAIMVPWCIIELLQGNYRFAFGLIIVYGLVVVIRNIIEPKIVGDKLGLNPIVSLVAIYLGFKLFGVLGMIAMPISTQIVMELHKRGIIHLFRDAVATEVPTDVPAPPTGEKES